MVYYHDGFLRVSMNVYDIQSESKGTFLTNTHLAKKIIKNESKRKSTGLNMTMGEMRQFQSQTMQRFQNYLYLHGIVSDPNWLDNYLRPAFKKAFIHFYRATAEPFLPRSSLYELIALDFLIDEDFKLWFVEGNTKPLIYGSTREKYLLLKRMLIDVFEIQVGLTRSRMKRIFELLARISDKYDLEAFEDVREQIFDQYFEEFQKISKNYFEPEFKPSANNSWSLIIDENKEGVDRYMGFLEEECI